MRMLITGANGFLGLSLCEAALKRGHEVHAFVRPTAGVLPKGVTRHEGNFCDAVDAERVFGAAKPEAIIHAAAVMSTGRPDPELSMDVNVGGTRTLLEFAEAAGCERWVQVSSMSAHEANRSVYGSTKFLADEEVRRSPLAWTIIRPSLIYGPRPMSIFHKMVTIAKKLPAIPLIGSGREPMRPVHVDDLANAIVSAAERRECIRQTYQLGGPEDWAFRDVMRAICKANGQPGKLLVPVPLPVCRMLAACGEAVLKNPPLITDNIEGIAKAQLIDTTAAERDLEFKPREFGMKL